MPPLPGFTNNPFQTHTDLKTSCLALLRALKPHQSPGGARIKLPLETGTHFDDIAAQLEGFARPLWAIATLLHANLLSAADSAELVEPYVRGLANGTDPQHDEYWGPVVLRDQRMVEMEIVAFALLAAPGELFEVQSGAVRARITKWLGTINGKDFPTTNWLWFRVMTNLALVKVCGVPREEGLQAMRADLELMEAFYLGDGWAADGVWSEGGRQADYYSGSFAIQFSQLVYAKFAWDLDPERCERFRERAVEFAGSFWRYFDTNGAAIPFGRSLTYRFAFAGFWSALAFSGIPDSSLPHPLNTPGTIKGLLLRHFSWWRAHPSMFNVDGTLTIGFAYPNMYMSEDYNSPQSVYWALKSFIALGVPANHDFWTEPARPFPLLSRGDEEKEGGEKEERIKLLKQPHHILINGTNHHFLLNSGQFCPWPLKATEAKYGKYAYSSHFGFSVPTGPLLAQLAPDSTLALSRDDGETWRVPWKLDGAGLKTGTATLLCSGGAATAQNEDVDVVVATMPTLHSTWKPWKDAEIEVQTILVPPCTRWPDWYVTHHRITQSGAQKLGLRVVQGGFAIQGRGQARGEVLPAYGDVEMLRGDGGVKSPSSCLEGTYKSRDNEAADVGGALVLSDAGASGIRRLDMSSMPEGACTSSCHDILKPDANTNLIWQRTLIPTVQFETEPGFQEVEFATGVFALARTEDRKARYDGVLDVVGLWGDGPVVGARGGSERENEGEKRGYWIRVE
ncbi:hypothetical protein IAQ61_011394 [Plenodomus lingam]|uniref:uncharacterized protein n=1 Tax=Leptosphaeria maculans TaxID=5022 RepID=UPI00332C1D86|nr:hypothetical protein IAQ61_011394 [Plenodomus lingam]